MINRPPSLGYLLIDANEKKIQNNINKNQMSLVNKDLFSRREEPLFSIKQPTLESPDSQLVSASQLYEKEGEKWIQLLK